MKNNNNVIIAIGSNLTGHMNSSKNTLDVVFNYLSKYGLRVRKASNIYISKPFPSGLGPLFYNRVILVKSNLSPLDILSRLKNIEKIFGKRSNIRNSPRVLDLDIIDYGGEIINYKYHLNLPHPKMQDRDFVLKPLYEIYPTWVNPSSGMTIKTLLYNYKRSNISIAKPI